MKHVTNVTKKANPAKAYVWDWFVNVKTMGSGIIFSGGKPAYVNELWNHDGAITPTDINDVGLF